MGRETKRRAPIVPHAKWYDALKQCAADGMTVTAAAKHIGMSTPHTSQWLRDCAPDLRPAFIENERKKRQAILTKRVPDVARWEQMGLANARMAEMLGLSEPGMHNWRTRHRKRIDAYKESVSCSSQQSFSDPSSSSS